MSKNVEKLANKSAKKYMEKLWVKVVEKLEFWSFTQKTRVLHRVFPTILHNDFHMNFGRFFPVMARFYTLST